MVTGRKAVAVACVLAAALAVMAGCAGAGSGVGSKSGGAVSPSSVSASTGASGSASPSGIASQAGGAIWFQTLQMNSATTGWALAYHQNPKGSETTPPQMLLTRTSDGARTWNDVTPAGALPALRSVNTSEVMDPADAEHAYLAVTASASSDYTKPSTTTVYATADGGGTWTASVPIRAVGTVDLLSFANAEDGWLTMEVPTNGNGQTPTWLYKTVDGGQHWTAVTSASPVPGLGLNDFCNSTALGFQTGITGWLTYSCRSGAYLLVTHNGGSTWTNMWATKSLPIPSSSCVGPGGPCTLRGPQFSGDSGFLAVEPQEGSPSLLTSDDLGQTWQLATLPPGAAQFPQAKFFSPVQGVLIPTGSQEALGDVFYTTDDAGQTWTPVQQGTHFIIYGSTMDFATPQVGFEWNTDGPTSTATGWPAIYTTTNTGRAWTAITPELSS